MTRTGIVDADGVERAVDVIVMATGFQPANYLARLRVVGRDGRTLQEHWADEPRAYLGITVPGFPNFFMLYGPGTNGGEIVIMLESQAEYAVRAMKRMIRERVTAVEVKPSFEARWYRWLQSQDGGHVLDDEQQLLHVTDRQDRDPVALRQPALPCSPRSLGRGRRPFAGATAERSRAWPPGQRGCNQRRPSHSSRLRTDSFVTEASGASRWKPWHAPG